MADLKVITVEGRQFVLVARPQLNLPSAKRATKPHGILPTPPAVFDWSNGGRTKFPVLGNDRYGDCFYCWAAHDSQCKTGMNGQPSVFDVNKLTARYLVIAHGDNGLSDGQIMPEYKAGIVGPNGPHRILDYMVINSNDDALTAFMMWAFCGAGYTCSLLDTWLANPKPGDTWDADGTPDPEAGHAVLLTGRNSRGGYDLQSWGFSPPINLTPRGLKAAQPEVIVVFSMEMFNAQGFAPCGMHYTTLAPLWEEHGGISLPPSPFPAPTPGPGPVIPPGPPQPPIPPVPGPQSFTIHVPTQPVLGRFGAVVGHVPAYTLTGTVGGSQMMGTQVHLPPWLLASLAQACAGTVMLPGMWGMLLPFLCALIPKASGDHMKMGMPITLPSWFWPVLRLACAEIHLLQTEYPAAYQIASGLCLLIPPAAMAATITPHHDHTPPCGCGH